MGIEIDFNILNQKGSPAIYQDTYAAIPNPSLIGRIFIGTDNGNLYRDTGTTWFQLATSGGGGGTNPTNLYIPYNDNGTFADSYIINDLPNSLLEDSLGQAFRFDFITAYNGYKITLGDHGENTNSPLTFNMDYTSGDWKLNTKIYNVIAGLKLDYQYNVYSLGHDSYGFFNVDIGNQFFEFFDGNGEGNNFGLLMASYGRQFRVGAAEGVTFDIVDSAGSYQYVRTTFNNNIKGINLDFLTDKYYFGEFDITNTGTHLFIDAVAQAFITKNNDVRIGLNFDFQNNQYAFGDFDYINNGSSLFIFDNNGTIFTSYQGFDKGLKLDLINFVYLLGDFNQINNGTYFKIDDVDLNYQFHNNGVSNGLYVDFNKNWYKFGDWNNQNNNSHFYIDDPNSKITWYSKYIPHFDDLGTGTMLSNSAFVLSGQYLVINVNGTTYKIQLFNP